MMSIHVGCLRVDLATAFQGTPVLGGEMIEFVVNDVILDELVELVKRLYQPRVHFIGGTAMQADHKCYNKCG